MDSTDSDPNRHLIPGVPHLNISPNPSPPQQAFYMNGKAFIAAGIILVIIVFFIVAFHVYLRIFWRRRPLLSWRHNLSSHDTPLAGGLDKAIVNSLPTFTYTTPLLHQGGDVVSKETGVIECAVCLIEFEENDACRLLPKCNHSFHTECIDKWFLSNTTCPLCRTSAEPANSDDACHAESPTVSYSPHQEHGDQIRRSNSSPSDCLLPYQDPYQDSSSHIERQDIHNHMQRSRSGSPLRADLEGAGLHVRRMLARTCSSQVDARYNLVGEDIHNDTMNDSVHSERSGSMGRDQAHRSRAGEAFVQHFYLPSWQRSISDRSLNTRQATELPSNVLFWGNHSHVDSHLHLNQGRVRGRSLPHVSIDVPRPQDVIPMPRSTLGSPSQCFSTSEGPCALSSTSVQCQPSRMNSLKSEESAKHSADHDMHR